MTDGDAYRAIIWYNWWDDVKCLEPSNNVIKCNFLTAFFNRVFDKVLVNIDPTSTSTTSKACPAFVEGGNINIVFRFHFGDTSISCYEERTSRNIILLICVVAPQHKECWATALMTFHDGMTMLEELKSVDGVIQGNFLVDTTITVLLALVSTLELAIVA
jgi:hypothetical protein